MKKIVKEYLLKDAYFYVFSIIAIGLLIASFLVPPLGTISPSVLEGVAEIFAFASLGTVIKAINKGIDAKVRHGDTTLTIGDLNSDNDTDNNYDYPSKPSMDEDDDLPYKRKH